MTLAKQVSWQPLLVMFPLRFRVFRSNKNLAFLKKLNIYIAFLGGKKQRLSHYDVETLNADVTLTSLRVFRVYGTALRAAQFGNQGC
jgi:hypothetical protein